MHLLALTSKELLLRRMTMQRFIKIGAPKKQGTSRVVEKRTPHTSLWFSIKGTPACLARNVLGGFKKRHEGELIFCVG
jgi:hypothetical protein